MNQSWINWDRPHKERGPIEHRLECLHKSSAQRLSKLLHTCCFETGAQRVIYIDLPKNIIDSAKDWYGHHWVWLSGKCFRGVVKRLQYITQSSCHRLLLHSWICNISIFGSRRCWKIQKVLNQRICIFTVRHSFAVLDVLLDQSKQLLHWIKGKTRHDYVIHRMQNASTRKLQWNIQLGGCFRKIAIFGCMLPSNVGYFLGA
mmetsp:Transcript_38257/g.92556  ORF Transcript_38257/g.92556 Transcript_38257/m.92556 type:complete len:202 (+) Transcript_38257:497-1102(+)